MTRSSMTKKDGLMMLIAGLIIAIIFTWADLYTNLRDYDTQTREYILQQFMNELVAEAENGSCENILNKVNYKSAYVNNADSGKMLASSVAGKQISLSAKGRNFPDTYIILADNNEIAEIKVDIEGYSSMLNLPKYNVTHMNGLVSSKIAVTDPSGYKVLDSELLAITPTSDNYIYPDLNDVVTRSVDVTVNPMYEYEIDGLFAIPELVHIHDEEGQLQSMVTRDGYSLSTGVFDFHFDNQYKDEVIDAVKRYVYYRVGDIEWDAVKGNFLSTSPVFSRVESMGATLYANQTLTTFGDFSISNPFMWNDKLFSAEIEYTYNILAPTGTITNTERGVFYFICGDDGQWRVCEIVDISR